MKLFTLFSSLMGITYGAFGPMSLYDAIEGTTLSLNGYTIQPYLSVQYQNVSYGSFNTYVAENNMYTYQYYTSGSAVGCASPRTMKLFIDCGTTASLGPVSEPTSCNYQGILEIPQACGISFAVGNELPSMTPSPSRNATAIATTSSSMDGYIGMILGALGVSGVGVVIAIQVYNAMKNKGGLGALMKANSAQIDKVINKIPVSDSMKKSVKSIAEKQVERIDSEIDKKLKSVRSKIATVEGRKPDEEEVHIEIPETTRRSSVVKSVLSPTVDLDKKPTSVVVDKTPAPVKEPEPLKPETVQLSDTDLEEFKKFLLMKAQIAAISK